MYDFIYPEEIDAKLQNVGKTSTEDKVKLFFCVLGIANFVGIFTLPSLLAGIGINTFFAILVQLFLNLFLLLTIGRFLVFDEKTKLKEYNSYSDDSLGRYYKIRDENSKEIELANGDTVTLIGYDDGTYMCCLRLRYGSNGEDKMDQTFYAFTEMNKALEKAKVEFKQLTSKENFIETDEYAKYVNKLNSIEYAGLSSYMMRIMDTAVKFSEQKSNVAVTHYIIRFKEYQTYEAAQVLHKLINIAEDKMNGFRSVRYITFKEYINLVREYYGLEVVDLAMLKIAEPTAEELRDILNTILVGDITTVDGKMLKPKGTEISPVSLAVEIDRSNERKNKRYTANIDTEGNKNTPKENTRKGVRRHAKDNANSRG
ncbi:hypothetical protein [Paraclostridium bifermentans]|uniref:hypothetical protein n=1 Tax=Paraclostridium bifermentans TaxID=1490 RepID=UPI00374FC81F